MDINQRTLRNGALVILAAVLLRIVCSLTLGGTVELFAQPKLADYLAGEPAQEPAQEPTDAPTQPTPYTKPVSFPEPSETEGSTGLSMSDAAYVQMTYSCSRKPDIAALLDQPLQWDLTTEAPAVLIIHTHGTEAFTPSEGMEYEEKGGAYRTTDDQVNIISIGDELTRLLEAAGMTVIHDREYYDYPDYDASYDICRKAMEKHLKDNPSIKLVVDLHRDSALNEDGSQWATSGIVNGQQSAQVMLVAGTDCYYDHPNWEQNLSLSLKLHALMERTHPGITRPLDLRKQRFNQDLSTGAIIAEIGTAGNTHEEAMSAVSVLAEAIIALSQGSE